MSWNDDDITPAVLLQRLQGMEKRIRDEFRYEIGLARTELGQRIDRVERKMDVMSVQISNIDARIDDIEVVQLPLIKRHIGLKAT